MTPKDAFRLIRLPNLLTIVLFQSLLHFGLIVPYLAEHGLPNALSTPRFLLLLAASVCLAAGGNAINDYFDVVADRINRPTRVVVGSSVDRRVALLVHVILTLMGVFMGGYLAFVLRRSFFMLLFVAVPIILWFYSTHLKRMVLIGNIVVALLVALTGYMVVSADFAAVDLAAHRVLSDHEPMSQLWFLVCGYCIFAFIANLGREVLKDIEDVDGDAAMGCHTLPVEMGVPYSKVVVILIELFMLVCLALACHEVPNFQGLNLLFIIALICVPTIAMCIMVVRGQERHHFHRAQILAKLVMLAGVCSLFFFF